MLTVSVVMPVRNAVRTLPACLAALEALDPAPDEILLVDNGSTDGSLEVLRAFVRGARRRGMRVLEEPRRGAAVTRNTGVGKATGDVIAFTDSDCVPDRAWLRRLAESFADPGVGAVAGRVTAARAVSTRELFSALYTLQLPDQASRQREWTPWEGGYPTANLAVRRELFGRLGGFDESVEIYGEDYDLCAKIYEQGLAIVYVPESVVVHHHRTTVGGLVRQAFGFGRSHAYMLRRHATRGLWLNLPGRDVAWRRCPMRAWIDVASADKKTLAIMAAGLVHAPFLWIGPLYVAWLALCGARRAGQRGMSVTPSAAVALAGLLLLKSAAMTAGRWWGSLKYGAVCL